MISQIKTPLAKTLFQKIFSKKLLEDFFLYMYMYLYLHNYRSMYRLNLYLYNIFYKITFFRIVLQGGVLISEM